MYVSALDYFLEHISDYEDGFSNWGQKLCPHLRGKKNLIFGSVVKVGLVVIRSSKGESE